MTNIHQLFRMQTIDTAIQEAKSELTQILQAQQEPAELTAARQEFASLTAREQQLRRDSREKELALGTLSAKLKATNDRLYSGKERNPKALQDLQQEAEYLQRHRSELEDVLLNLMVSLEEVEERLATVKDTLAGSEEAWTDQLARLKSGQYETATRLNELLVQRQAQAARIDARSLKLYEGLLKSKRGTAVALVRNDTCQGCQVTLDAGVLRAVRHGELATCRTCGRLLFSDA